MHYNVYAMFSRTFEILNLLNQREEQTLIAFISLNDYNDAPWAYNGRDKSENKLLNLTGLKLPMSASSLVQCRHLNSVLHAVVL